MKTISEKLKLNQVSIEEKLKLNKQSQVVNEVSLEKKIKLALSFDPFIFDDIFNVYFDCFKRIRTFAEDTLNVKDLNIYMTKKTWENKLKGNNAYDKYKYLFIIDDDEFKKINKKYENNLYYFCRSKNGICLAIDHPLENYGKAMYFSDNNDNNKFIQCWFTEPSFNI